MASKGGMQFTIGGVKVQFPVKPYPSQFCLMDKIIRGLERQQNCLLESPTGSGKSLALLCSALAWQAALNEKLTKESIDRQNAEASCGKPCTCGADQAKATHTEYSPESKPGKESKAESKADGDKDRPVEIDSNEDDDDDDDDDDFKPSGKMRTPLFGKGKKRKHVQIEYEDDTKPVEEQETKCTCNTECNTEIKKKPKLPKIFFCTRTHKQIAQIVRELGKTEYHDVKMAILGSREHSCIHPEVSKMKNKNEGCKDRLDGPGCKFNDRAKRVLLSQRQLQEHLPTAWDLEDLITACWTKKACPYFVTKNIWNQADIIFCPYNYLIDPLIRQSMEMNLKEQIVILDEAHNIEDCARDAAGGSITTPQINQALDNITDKMKDSTKHAEYEAWRTLLLRLMQIFNEHSCGQMQHLQYDTTYKAWHGFDIAAKLKAIGLGPQEHSYYKQKLESIMAEEKSQDQGEGVSSRFQQQEDKLHTSTLKLLEQLLQITDYMYRNDMKYITDFKLVLMRSMQHVPQKETNNGWMGKRYRRTTSVEMVNTLHFWCMNPGVAFSDLKVCRSIILTSGTLSPMQTFASELDTPFEIMVEASHVIHNSQTWVGAIGRGPGGSQLYATFKNKESFAFQDELGNLLLRVCRDVPHGVLCFLSSYRDVEKFVQRWKATLVWNHICSRKRVFIEPRAADKDKFDNMMKAFYDVVDGNIDSEFLDPDEDHYDASEIDGALFIAVCRGKVSEGMDFADNNARAVLTVGIPYPSIKDLQVTMKKAYNDSRTKTKRTLGGDEWYEIQAFRALNQALGRCIRHRYDWGALILVDDRFVTKPDAYQKGLSKWIRKRVVSYRDFDAMERSLAAFTHKLNKDGGELPASMKHDQMLAKNSASQTLNTSCLNTSGLDTSGLNTSGLNTSGLNTSLNMTGLCALFDKDRRSSTSPEAPKHKAEEEEENDNLIIDVDIQENETVNESSKEDANSGHNGASALTPYTNKQKQQKMNQIESQLKLQSADMTIKQKTELKEKLIEAINDGRLPRDKQCMIVLSRGKKSEMTLLIQPNTLVDKTRDRAKTRLETLNKEVELQDKKADEEQAQRDAKAKGSTAGNEQTPPKETKVDNSNIPAGDDRVTSTTAKQAGLKEKPQTRYAKGKGSTAGNEQTPPKETKGDNSTRPAGDDRVTPTAAKQAALKEKPQTRYAKRKSSTAGNKQTPPKETKGDNSTRLGRDDRVTSTAADPAGSKESVTQIEQEKGQEASGRKTQVKLLQFIKNPQTKLPVAMVVPQVITVDKACLAASRKPDAKALTTPDKPKQVNGFERKNNVTQMVSIINKRLLVANIPRNKSQEDIMEAFSLRTDGLTAVKIEKPGEDENEKNGGFAYLTYDSHQSAATAKYELLNTWRKVWNNNVLVCWAGQDEELKVIARSKAAATVGSTTNKSRNEKPEPGEIKLEPVADHSERDVNNTSPTLFDDVSVKTEIVDQGTEHEPEVEETRPRTVLRLKKKGEDREPEENTEIELDNEGTVPKLDHVHDQCTVECRCGYSAVSARKKKALFKKTNINLPWGGDLDSLRTTNVKMLKVIPDKDESVITKIVSDKATHIPSGSDEKKWKRYSLPTLKEFTAFKEKGDSKQDGTVKLEVMEDSDEEFLNTRRKAGRKRSLGLGQTRSGVKRARGVEYEDEEGISKENKRNGLSVSCCKCGITWITREQFERVTAGLQLRKSEQNDFERVTEKDFLLEINTKNFSNLSIQTKDIKLLNLQPYSIDSGESPLNSFYDEEKRCCVQYLQCEPCGKTSGIIGARVVIADPSSTFKTGQVWFLASTAKS